MSAFSVENSHDGKIFENYTRFEWGVELGVVAIFMLRLFVPHEFDMKRAEGVCWRLHSSRYYLSAMLIRHIDNIFKR